MKNLKTRSKLLLGFGAVAILLIIVGVLSIYGLSYMVEVSDVLNDNYSNASQAASKIDSAATKQFSLIRGMYVNFDDHETTNSYASEIKQADQDVKDAMAEYGKDIAGVETTTGTYVASFDTLYFGAYTDFVNEAISLAAGDDREALRQLILDNRAVVADLENYIVHVVSAIDSDGESYNLAANATSSALITAVIIISVVAVIISVVLGFYNSNVIAKPLIELSEQAKEVSVGNTDISIEQNRRDEIGILAGTFSDMISAINDQSNFLNTVSQGDFRSDIPVRSEKDTMNKALNKLVESNNEMIAKIRMSSEQVSSASTQIAQAAQTLASGSTEQAASVDEFTTTLNDILEQTNKNAQLSIEALEGVNEAVRYMDESTSLMSELLTAMKSIDESSQNITKVIKTIEDIAFQTNILALNAAVEAAHAGQHGRGFAVVAEEVRSLASDSSVAAKETAELIESSAQRVREGNELVTKTNICMKSMSESSLKVQQAVSFIAEASNQQARAIAELHQGLEQISQVVQANSATSQETAASAEEMSSQAMILDETVAEFKLSDKYDRRLGSVARSGSLPTSSYSETSSATQTSYAAEEFVTSNDFGKY